MKKRIVIIVVKYGLGLGLLAWVVWQYWTISTPQGEDVGIGATLDNIINGKRQIHWLPFLTAALFCLTSMLLTFLRWFILVRAQDLPFTIPNAVRLGLIGYYLNIFLPGAVGGDIIKAAFIAREQKRRTVAVSTVVLDRVVGLCGLVWLCAIMGILFWLSGSLMGIEALGRHALEFIILGATVIMVGSLVFWFLLGFLSSERAESLAARLARIPKAGHSLAEFWRSVWIYRCRGRAIAMALGISLISHTGLVFAFYFAAQTLTPVTDLPPLVTHFLIVPVGMTIRAGIPTPGGIGGGEVAFGTLYELLGYSAAAGILALLVQRVVEWSLGLVGYLVFLRMKPALREAEAASAPELAPDAYSFSEKNLSANS
ncbi:MAG TPA: lysylphosphatidylglycerol synthase transmembrane domain-containing protein [Gemmataceae bacterium]|nr:lysylphosphatidylglycerol synthase transmembrane domain-containing protein [Gemmataceae bacterium]